MFYFSHNVNWLILIYIYQFIYKNQNYEYCEYPILFTFKHQLISCHAYIIFDLYNYISRWITAAISESFFFYLIQFLLSYQILYAPNQSFNLLRLPTSLILELKKNAPHYIIKKMFKKIRRRWTSKRLVKACQICIRISDDRPSIFWTTGSYLFNIYI